MTARTAIAAFTTWALLASGVWSQPSAISLVFADAPVEQSLMEPGTHVYVFPSELFADSAELPSGELSDVDPLPCNAVETLDDTTFGSHFPYDGGISRAPGHPAKPKRKRPGDINRGDCPPLRYQMEGDVRAGCPQCVAPWARCSTSPKYSGGFVGGGAAHCGRSRRHEEGTWGVDYHGHFSPRRIFLNWTCGREQGGEGAYRTDGESKVVSAAKERIEGNH